MEKEIYEPIPDIKSLDDIKKELNKARGAKKELFEQLTSVKIEECTIQGKSSRKYKQKAKECKMPKKKKKYESFERKQDIMSAIEVPQEEPKKADEPAKPVKHDPPPEDVVKRNKNMFKNMMSHLTKAKTKLEQESEHFKKQELVEKKVIKEIQSSVQQLREEKMKELSEKELKLLTDMQSYDKTIINLNYDLIGRAKRYWRRMSSWDNTFKPSISLNREKPPIFWCSGSTSDIFEPLLKETKQILKAKYELTKSVLEAEATNKIEKLAEKRKKAAEFRKSQANA